MSSPGLPSSPAGTAFDPISNRWTGAPQLPALPEAPLVSVIVPSYNQGRFIGDTIESILAQSYQNFEIVVVDGASTDETLDVLDRFRHEPRLRVLSEPDQGVADAVNKGFQLARGEVLAIQSSDDCYEPGAFEVAVQALHSPDCPAIAYGEVTRVDASGRALSRSHLSPYSLEAWLTKRTYIPQPASFFRRDLMQRIGGWDSAYYNADTEFWLRLLWQAPVHKLDQVLARRRMHEAQRDTQKAMIAESFARMMASSPLIRSLPWSLRRAARAGALIHRVRYNPRPGPWSNGLLLWRAVLSYPPLLRHLPARHRMVPFGAWSLSMAGRLRRMVFPSSR